MHKFILDQKDGNLDHLKYCIKHDLPFIRIIPAIKYSKVEFDVDCMLNFYQLTKDPSEFLMELYKAYAEFFKLPSDKFNCMGGTKSLIFTLHKEHAEFFATQLFNYLNDFVKTNRKLI